MKCLEEICFKEICNNLSYISLICETRKWEIPSFMADKILDYVFKHKRSVNKDEMKIFSRKIMKLTKFTSSPRIFHLPFCDFLDGHELNILSLRSLLHFGFESREVKVITNSFSIENVLFVDYEQEDLDHLFQYSIQIKESIFIKFMKNEQFISSFMYALRNSCETLKILSIKDCYFSEKDLEDLSIFFSSNSSLEELILHGNLHELDSGYLKMVSSLRNSCKSLKTLNLKEIPDQNTEFSDMLSNMTNLEELSLEFTPRKKDLISEKSIFQILIENNLKNLKKLKLNFHYVPKGLKCEIENFFKKYQTIEIIEIENSGEYFDCESLNGLMYKFCKNLKKFRLPRENYSIVNNLSFNIFIENCSNLNELYFDFGNWCSKNTPTFLIKSIEKSRSTLKSIFVYYLDEEYVNPFLKSIQKLKCLEKFGFGKFKANLQTQLTLKNIIEMNKDNLLELNLKSSYVNDESFLLLIPSLSKCCRLKILKLKSTDNLFGINYFIISGLLFLKDIEILSVSVMISTDIEIIQLVEDLDKCVNLRELSLRFQNVELTNFNNTRVNLEATLEKVKLSIGIYIRLDIEHSFDSYHISDSPFEEDDSYESQCEENSVTPNKRVGTSTSKNDKIKIREKKFPDDDSFYQMLYYYW